MTQLTQYTYAIEVPEDADCLGIRNTKLGGFVNDRYFIKTLPPGEYEIVCQDSKRITEEEAFKIVEHHLAPFDNTIIGFEDYTDVGYTSCETAQESFTTLLQSKHLNPSIRYVIILKTK